MQERYQSIFDIIGPVMVGPSSSHTAGAAELGRLARKLLGQQPQQIRIDYYESFAKTHRGHGTDFAIVGGILNLAPDDPQLPHSLELAKQRNIDVRINEQAEISPIGHPNTALITLSTDPGRQIMLAGCSIGGGKTEIRRLEINGGSLELPGPLPILILTCKQASLAAILAILGKAKVDVLAESTCHNEAEQQLIALSLAAPITEKLQQKISRHCSQLVSL